MINTKPPAGFNCAYWREQKRKFHTGLMTQDHQKAIQSLDRGDIIWAWITAPEDEEEDPNILTFEKFLPKSS